MVNSVIKNKEQNIFKFLWNFLKHKKLWLLFWFFIEIFLDFIGIFVAQYFNKQTVNYFSIENPVLKTGLLLVFLYVFFNQSIFIIKILRLKVKSFTLGIISNNIRNNLFNYTMQHSMNYFNNSFSGAISAKISSVAENYKILLSESMRVVTSFIVFIFIIIFFADINIYLSISFFIFGSFAYYIFSKTSIEYSLSRKVVSEKYSQYFGFIVDDFTNIRNIKIFSNFFQEKINSKKYILNIRKAEKSMIQSQIKNQFTLFIGIFLLFFSLVCISGILLIENYINYGDFVYIMIIISISRSILIRFIGAYKMISESKGNIKNGLETIYKPIEIKDKNKNKLRTKYGKIVFKNVNFIHKMEDNNEK